MWCRTNPGAVKASSPTIAVAARPRWPHAEDARGGPIRVEDLQIRDLFTGAHELDGLARDLAHGKRRAAPGIAVHLGEHDAGDIQALVEGGGHGDRVLTGHGL